LRYLLVDGKLLTSQTLNHNQPGEFFKVETPLPPALIAGKSEITVRFEPTPRNVAGGLFRCAVLKAAKP
jgi:hypothetical protein